VLVSPLEDAARLVEVVAGVKHELYPQPVPAPLPDLVEVAAVGIERSSVSSSSGPIVHRLRLTPQSCYLSDPILGRRLRDCVRRIIGHKGKSAFEILGSPDDLKLRSCLTLFAQAASDDSDRLLFTEGLDQFYDGKPDQRTLELLGLTTRNVPG
jgi:hypothetical protein